MACELPGELEVLPAGGLPTAASSSALTLAPGAPAPCTSEPGINQPSPVSELPALLRALLRGRDQAHPGSSFPQNQVVPKGLRSDSRRPGGDVWSPACSLHVQPVPFGPTSVPPALRMARPPPHQDPPWARPASKACRTTGHTAGSAAPRRPGLRPGLQGGAGPCQEGCRPFSQRQKRRGSSRVLPRDHSALGQLSRPPAPAPPPCGAPGGHQSQTRPPWNSPWASAHTGRRG